MMDKLCDLKIFLISRFRKHRETSDLIQCFCNQDQISSSHRILPCPISKDTLKETSKDPDLFPSLDRLFEVAKLAHHGK